MKNIRLLVLAAAGFSVFIAGLVTSSAHWILHLSLLIAGATIILFFYFSTLVPVFKMARDDVPKKIFWLIAIICMPVIGNIIYLIFQETANRKQKPHGVF